LEQQPLEVNGSASVDREPGNPAALARYQGNKHHPRLQEVGDLRNDI